MEWKIDKIYRKTAVFEAMIYHRYSNCRGECLISFLLIYSFKINN
jgi:hypothetical protein